MPKPKAPFDGAVANCAHCGIEFVLTMYQRSDIRTGKAKLQFCGGGCQRGFHGAANGRDNAHKISATHAAMKEPGATWYRKVRGVHEHRVVAAEKLGRALTSKDVVHHKNHDKRDNRPENLEVMTHAEHMRLHLHQPRKEKS
jgi:hypothetical protein